MNELKEKLAALGLSEEQIDPVIETVADFVKSKVPEDYQGMVDQLMAGEKPDLGGLLGKVKGFFG
ncbi:MAG: hypothetical protein ACQKBY_09675 [Verrucomicrobiales bacterium]